MKKLKPRPTETGSTSATYRLITALRLSARTRVTHEEGERLSRRARFTLLRRPLCCSSLRMLRSVRSLGRVATYSALSFETARDLSLLQCELSIDAGPRGLDDSDALETREWLQSLEAVVKRAGKERGRFLLKELETQAQQLGLASNAAPYPAYRNTIYPEDQPVHPGNVELADRITVIMRWNALVMVVRANKAYGELGGHIAVTPARPRYSRSG